MNQNQMMNDEKIRNLKKELSKLDDDIDWQELIVFCKEKAKESENNKIKEIIIKYSNNENMYIKYLLEGLNHQKLGIKPSFEGLGYLLADNYNLSKTFTTEDKKIEREIEQYFDKIEYIYNNTHYDECSNGFFFRRS